MARWDSNLQSSCLRLPSCWGYRWVSAHVASCFWSFASFHRLLFLPSKRSCSADVLFESQTCLSTSGDLAGQTQQPFLPMKVTGSVEESQALEVRGEQWLQVTDGMRHPYWEGPLTWFLSNTGQLQRQSAFVYWGSVIKNSKLTDLNRIQEARSLRSSCRQGWFLLRPLSSASSRPFCPCVLTHSFFRMYLHSHFPFLHGHGPSRWESTLMNSFYLCYLFQGLISKWGHIVKHKVREFQH